MTNDVGQRLVKLAEGTYVEYDTLNIVKKIQEYDPNLTIKYCDPARSEINDAPYLLVEKCPDGHERIVFYIWELDERVLERVQAADRYSHDIMGQIDTANRLAQENQEQRYRETILEANDIVAAYLKTSKGRFSFVEPITGNKVTIDDQEGIPAKVERPEC